MNPKASCGKGIRYAGAGCFVKHAPEEIARIAPSEATGWEHVRLYRMSHYGSVRFPAAEVSAAAWFPIAEIEAWLAARPEDFSSGFIECWNAALPLIRG